ncbi:MAG: hypothetical protein OXU20_28535 [Myxococcales bacterium]|nr:hypothetical protein [Myxococcales bacterium]MDD9970571.1 hypothetical protein [Myxococcales bacterium]
MVDMACDIRPISKRNAQTRWKQILRVTLTLSLYACATDDSHIAVADKGHALFAKTSVLWNPGQVDVCWEDMAGVPLQERNWVRDAIARTWSFAGDLEFVGWGQCSSGSAGVRIIVEDVMAPGPHTLQLGADLDGVPDGVSLNHVFENWRASDPNISWRITCNPGSSEQQRRECIEGLAIHEFGHVAGFEHEGEAAWLFQPDYPPGYEERCAPHTTTGFNGTGDELYNGIWDLESVMNRCSPAYPGATLTATDFAGMQHFYGPSPRFVAAVSTALL